LLFFSKNMHIASLQCLCQLFIKSLMISETLASQLYGSQIPAIVVLHCFVKCSRNFLECWL
jgi:hypothetical protein